MTGLLKKDLYVADKSGRLLLVLALVFSMVPSLGAFGSTYAMMMAFMLPLNSIAYDERCKWDRYAAMLPYKPEQIVWSKYVLSYIYTLLAECIIILGALVRSRLKDMLDMAEEIQTGMALVVAMLLITALGFPVLYRFGSEKGRLVMILVMGAGIGIALGIMSIFDGTPGQMSFQTLMLIGVAAAVALTLVSFRLSVRFYRNRQNGAYD